MLNKALLEEKLSEMPLYVYTYVDPNSIEYSDRIRWICQHECPMYGKTWACPPGVGTVAECAKKCRSYGSCLMIGTITEAEDITNIEETLKTRPEHEAITNQVRELFRQQGIEPYILSTEACSVCDRCAILDGAPCRKPERMHPCVESHGINLIPTLEENGLEFQYGDNIITWYSLLFFNETQRRMNLKKLLSVFLAMLLLCGCAAQNPQETEPVLEKGQATEAEIAHLESLYEGREAFHGEFHDHASTGEKSDGKADLNSWKVNMLGKEMDFATIVDHRQYMHMELPEWDETQFIGGSEPGTKVLDLVHIEQNSMHYNMIFATAEEFKKFLSDNNEKFNFRMDEGGEGYFFWSGYEGYTSQQLLELSKTVREYGGFFNHNHPLGDSYLKSNNVLDYWYGDYTGFEVFCGFYDTMNDRRNQAAYNTWVGMLNEGKKVYATAGSDSHQLSKTVSLSTIYATERHASAYLEQFRNGNFTAGPIGIRMCIGDTVTGGETAFDGQRLVIAVGDFHPQEFFPSAKYRINVYHDTNKVFSETFTTEGETVYFALETEDAMYYRAEIVNESTKTIVAIGNPIWNVTQ